MASIENAFLLNGGPPPLIKGTQYYHFLPPGGRHRGRRVSIENTFLINCGPPPLIPPPEGESWTCWACLT